MKEGYGLRQANQICQSPEVAINTFRIREAKLLEGKTLEFMADLSSDAKLRLKVFTAIRRGTGAEPSTGLIDEIIRAVRDKDVTR